MSVVELVEAKTSELTGKPLDWALAQASEGVKAELHEVCCGNGVWSGNPSEPPECCGSPAYGLAVGAEAWEPTVDGSQALALIHKHAVSLEPSDPWVEYGNQWQAMCITSRDDAPHSFHTQHGPDPITAGLRAVVGAVSGETVLIPSVLME